ncbi:hypothetical protein Tco_1017153 [Tanacetum coccineum]|uniref:Uncharacterized protein n=1 Tax=Tanacetum coccineum TaxID=301880 RepID=A0ABQ5FS12_9ASTR
MPELYSGDSWTIEGWFRSGVNSIGVSQTSTMSEGPQQSRGVRRTRLGTQQHVLGDEGATTASEEVEAEPHFYFQLMSGGATSEGAEADQTILMTRHPNLLELQNGKNMVDPQPEREWVQGVEEEGMRMGSQEGPVVPASLGETTTFLAFIKENIEVSRTLIREHDQHDKIGEAPQ